MRRWVTGLVLVLGSLSPGAADEKPSKDAITAREALQAARELTRLVGEGQIELIVRKYIDTDTMIEGIFGVDLQRLDKLERGETGTVLGLLVGDHLARWLATNDLARVVDFDAIPPVKGRVVITVRVQRTGKQRGGARLVFAKRSGHVRVVDLGPASSTFVARTRDDYGLLKTRGNVRRNPLAFVWSIAGPHVVEKYLAKPLWRASLPEPNPAWLSREMFYLQIEAPRLAGVAVDRPTANSDADPWLLVVLSRNGTVGFRPSGRFGSLRGFRLGSEDPGEQDYAIQEFIQCLAAATQDPATRKPDGYSKLRAMIHADGGTKWKYVQWIMQAFAHPKVKVHSISFSLRRTEAPATMRLAKAGKESPYGRIDVALPAHLSRHDQPSPPRVRVKVFRRNIASATDAYTIVKVDLNQHIFKLPQGWKGRVHESAERIKQYDAILAALLSVLQAKVAAHGGAPDMVGEVVAPPPKGGSVPHEDVMQMVHLLRRAGIDHIQFEGAATPLTASERAARNARPPKKR